MVDVIAASETLGDPGDVLDVYDGVGNRLAGDGVVNHALDAGMNLYIKDLPSDIWCTIKNCYTKAVESFNTIRTFVIVSLGSKLLN